MDKLYEGAKLKFIDNVLVFEINTGNTYTYKVNDIAIITKKVSKNNFIIDNKYFISRLNLKENAIERS